MFRKYQEFTNLVELRNNPYARWCPILTCSNAIVSKEKDIAESKIVYCYKCGFRFCFNCRREFHGENECSAEEREDDKHFQLYLENQKNKTKLCPKCKIIISKNDGCNHMTCSVCKHQFCWLCTSDYSYDHFSARTSSCYGFQYSVADSLEEAKAIAVTSTLTPPPPPIDPREARRIRRRNRVKRVALGIVAAPFVVAGGAVFVAGCIIVAPVVAVGYAIANFKI